MQPEETLQERCRKLIIELGLGDTDTIASIEPLTGGVSSDIALVDFGTTKVCVKFALPSLKVEEEWNVTVERNLAEYLWLEFVSEILPESTPNLLGRSAHAYGFAMEFVEGADVYLWKQSLLDNTHESGEAGKVGHALGYIHKCSTTQLDLRKQFQNQDDFHALRLEPYLSFTAGRHPDIAETLNKLIKSQNEHGLTLIHGDISPKNIMFRNARPVFLDAECATVGDPSFDCAFCLNHLVLKSIHLPQSRHSLLNAVNQFWSAYREFVSWEPLTGLEQRVSELLPALMLARIDGKSPVEYLDESNRTLVRALARELIADPSSSLMDVTQRIHQYLENES